ncbi:MAG: hypothetical protein AB7O92_23545 [Acidimicrobiia bacterium]
MTKVRLLAHLITALLPPRLKPFVYRRIFRYHIGRGVRIGLSIIDARHCIIGDDVRIGHGNLFIASRSLTIGARSSIGFGNLVRGGELVELGEDVSILRFNEINSIVGPLVTTVPRPELRVGAGSTIASNHKIDFTDAITMGRRVIIGGRNSSIWTHNRQETAPIVIGDYGYIGSDVKMAPGSEVPAHSIVGIGSVVTGRHAEPGVLLAGVPAQRVRSLPAATLAMLNFDNRAEFALSGGVVTRQVSAHG